MNEKFLNNNMTEQLDPSSVLAYLNEMGYYNISTLQLKEFLKGIKVLIAQGLSKNLFIKREVNKEKKLIILFYMF